MRINSKLGVQHAAFDGSDAGEGLAVFLSQNSNSVSRFRFLVKGMTGEGIFQVGTFYSSPPNASAPGGELTRLVGVAICPGVTSWAVEVSCADTEITPETAEVILASSKCCTAPVGVSRVSERYGYLSGTSVGPVNIAIKPGQTITRISLFGLGGGGTAAINSGPTITVPAGATVVFEPKAPIPQRAIQVLAFTNINWVVEYLESA